MMFALPVLESITCQISVIFPNACPESRLQLVTQRLSEAKKPYSLHLVQTTGSPLQRSQLVCDNVNAQTYVY